MRTRIVSLFLGAAVLLAGCSPKLTYTKIKAKAPLEPEAEVAVLSPNMPEPENATVLETINIGDTGFTSTQNGTYEAVIALAKEEARKAGGNVVRITQHWEPDMSCTIHRIEGVILWVDDLDSLPTEESSSEEEAAPVAPAGKTVFPWRFAVHGGGGYVLAPVSNDLEPILYSHAKDMKWGFSYGADAICFFGSNIGAGIKFHNLHVGHQMPITVTYDDGSSRSGSLEDRVHIIFLGPVLSSRLPHNNNRNVFYSHIGVGYVMYTDKAVVIDPYRAEGDTIGFLAELGYDISLAKNLALGLNLTYMGASLSHYTVTNNKGQMAQVDLEKGKYDGLGHLTLSLGLRYNLAF